MKFSVLQDIYFKGFHVTHKSDSQKLPIKKLEILALMSVKIVDRAVGFIITVWIFVYSTFVLLEDMLNEL